MGFKNLKIQAKLMTAFMLIILIFTMVNIVNLMSLNRIAKGAESLNTDMKREILGEMALYEEIEFALFNQQLAAQSFLLTDDPTAIERYHASGDAADLRIQEALKIVDGEEERKELQDILEYKETYEMLFDKVMVLWNEDKREDAISLFMNNAKSGIGALHKQIKEATSDSHEDIETTVNRVLRQAQATTLISIAGILIAIFLSLMLSVFLARMITIPIHQINEAAKKISMGDMDGVLEVNSKDELGELSATFNRMLSAMRVFLSEESEIGNRKKEQK